jgi:hypothetical protein
MSFDLTETLFSRTITKSVSCPRLFSNDPKKSSSESPSPRSIVLALPDYSII